MNHQNKNRKNKKNSKSNITLILFGIIILLAASTVLFRTNGNKGDEQGNNENVLILTDSNFEEYSAEGLLLVDFWATWCKPCLAQAPIVEKVASEYKGKAVVAKLDVDKNRETAAAYNVAQIPTIILFQNGKVVERFIGVQNEQKLQETLNKYL